MRYPIVSAALAAGVLLGAALPSQAAADPIEGRWAVSATKLVTIAPCDADFCITHASGKRMARLTRQDDGTYTGTIRAGTSTTNLTARVNGNLLQIANCSQTNLCVEWRWVRN